MSLSTRLLLIDNYDSFTRNLYHLLLSAGAVGVNVVQNDKFSVRDIKQADALVLSPGPGLPSEAGQLKQLISEFSERKKMLGVCLGHQAIAETFGAQLIHSGKIVHGEASFLSISHHTGIFENLPSRVKVGRYHSWVVSPEQLPSQLEITATTGVDVIMAIRHKYFNINGLQFHPESILTPLGEKMIRNWLKI
jgi:anthranilate synthase component 2